MNKFKQTKAVDLRSNSSEELIVMEENLRKELFLVLSHRKDSKVDVPYKRHALRKDIARIKTVLKEKAASAAQS